MSKTTIAGNAVVVTSSLKLEDIKTVEKYRPTALKLVEEIDGHKEEVFSIGTHAGNGGLGKYGVIFGRANDDGYAQITMVADMAPADVKQYVIDEFGVALNKLNQLEAKVADALSGICDERNAVLEGIEVIA